MERSDAEVARIGSGFRKRKSGHVCFLRSESPPLAKGLGKQGHMPPDRRTPRDRVLAQTADVGPPGSSLGIEPAGNE